MKSFTPNTVIKSADVNSNFTQTVNHGLNFTMKWSFVGTLAVYTATDYLSLPDNATLTRCDLAANTAPTGQAIIADIERSTDGGSTWTTIFTGGTNRPQIAISAFTGNTTTIDVSAVTKNTHLFRAKVAQVGSGVAGANLSVMLRGTYNLD